MEDDKETKDLKKCFELVVNDEEEISVVPLAIKPAPIVDYRINTKGELGYYEITKADGSKTYIMCSANYFVTLSEKT
ncbi:hypothetical protein Tco_0963441 [Tanacetum coccineum]